MNNVGLPTLLKQRTNVYEVTFGNDLILLCLEKGEYYHINSSAQALWHCLKTPCTQEHLSSFLKATYQITQAQAKKDTKAWLASAVENGLVEGSRLEKVLLKTPKSYDTQVAYQAPTLENFTVLDNVADGDGNINESLSGDGLLMS
ncbi:MAG: PqqD family protein [Gammaproteobacteria bacterium]|nr:PqqD family protein [Gammaproteobacteria bacterium]